MKPESRTLLTIASSLIGSASADETITDTDAQALIGINGSILLLLEPEPAALFPPPAEDTATLKARIVQLEHGMWEIYGRTAIQSGESPNLNVVVRDVRSIVRKATEPTEPPVEPAIPNPPAGYSLYRNELAQISELRAHDSHEPIMHWSRTNACWEAGLSRHGGFKFYAIKKGSALSYRCKLETLKLEAGKRYVLENGRVTDRLYTASQMPFATGINDVLFWVATDGSVMENGVIKVGQISHPFES